MQWNFSQGTALQDKSQFNGQEIDAERKENALSDDFYYIVSEKCTECQGFHEEPQCAAVCPVDCCIPNPDRAETQQELLRKKAWMHDEA